MQRVVRFLMSSATDGVYSFMEWMLGTDGQRFWVSRSGGGKSRGQVAECKEMLRNVKLRWYKGQVCTAAVFETTVYMEPRDSECALRDTELHLDPPYNAKLLPLVEIPCKFWMKGEGMFGWFFDAKLGMDMMAELRAHPNRLAEMPEPCSAQKARVLAHAELLLGEAETSESKRRKLTAESADWRKCAAGVPDDC